jgi:Stress responsive A/B Barrel Domain
MIAHVVLFRPRVDLSKEAREALAASFEAALTQIPSIRRARVGRRIDYTYAAVIEFDNRAGLMAYLDHPAHEQLASRFFSAFEEALMYDFELLEGTAGLSVSPTTQ